MAEDIKPTFDQWCVCELLGHKRLAGRVTEVNLFGQALARVDIPNADGGFSTQFFHANSVYRLSIVTEEAARAVALACITSPVHPWEIPKQLPAKEIVPYDQESPIEFSQEDDDIDPEDLPRW